MLAGVVLTTHYSTKVVSFLKGFEQTFGIKVWHFLAHPVALIVMWLPGIIFRIAYISGYYGVWLDAINIAFSSSSGLINAIIYGYQSIKAFEAPRATEGQKERLSADLLGRFTIQPGFFPDVENRNTTRKSKALMIM